MGALHGLAGSGAFVVLLLAALDDVRTMIFALVLFAAMSIRCMVLCTGAFASILRLRALQPRDGRRDKRAVSIDCQRFLRVGEVTDVEVRLRGGQGTTTVPIDRSYLDGFALEDPHGTISHLDEVWGDQRVRMNEGACDPGARFYCGSMAYDQRPGGGSVYRLDPDRSVHLVLIDVTISNCLEWSPDASLAYYTDTPTRRISVFDCDTTAGLTGRRVVRRGRRLPGRPHGRCAARRLGAQLRRWGGAPIRA
jgi:hypothetical protein